MNRILVEWIDNPSTSFFGRGEVPWDNQLRCVQTDEIIDEHVDEDGENHAEVAHFRTNLKLIGLQSLC